MDCSKIVIDGGVEQAVDQIILSGKIAFVEPIDEHDAIVAQKYPCCFDTQSRTKGYPNQAIVFNAQLTSEVCFFSILLVLQRKFSTQRIEFELVFTHLIV